MRARCLAAPFAAALVAGCATTSGHDRVAERDPLEKVNRAVYGFNRGLDRAVLKPVAKGYRAIVPEAGRRGATNVFNNVDEPLTFINALLQGKIGPAFRAAARFVINTTLGVGGLADHATAMGLPAREEDFGQTLAVWGVPSGPYLMLPLLGPSTLRDTAGLGIEFAGGDPYQVAKSRWIADSLVRYGLTGVELVSARERFLDSGDAFLAGSADEYATIRSAYLQSRRNEIADGAPPADPGDDLAPAEGAADPDALDPDALDAAPPADPDALEPAEPARGPVDPQPPVPVLETEESPRP